MNIITSATVTLEELKTYFKHGGETPIKSETWRSRAMEDGSGGFIAESPTYDIELKPKNTIFNVSIESLDDPSDSSSSSTDNPIRFIVDFLKSGNPAGDELFGKLAGLIRRTDAFTPLVMSSILRYSAQMIESGDMNFRSTVRLIRRLSLFPKMDEVTNVMKVVTSSLKVTVAGLAEDRKSVEVEAIKELMNGMEKKGWKVSESEENDLPVLKVNISDIYEATIKVDHVQWSYKFQYVGAEDTLRKGVTDDPIAEFERYKDDSAVQSSRTKAKEKKKQEQEESADKATVPPKRKPAA